MSKFKQTDFKNAVRRNVEKQQKEASGYGYLNLPKGVQMFKEKEGKMYLDIIPYGVKMENHPDLDRDAGIAEAGSLWYKFPFKIHRDIGANNDAVVCPSTFGKKCPICDYMKKRAKEGAEWEELKAYKPGKRNLYAVIPIGDKKMEEEIHIWDVSSYLFQNLLNEELSDREDYAVFPALEGGKTLCIRFEEQQLGKNKFCEAKRIDFEKRKEDYDESIIDEVPCLEELLKVLSYKELETMMFELDPEDVDSKTDNDSNEEDAPVVKKKKIIRKSIEEEEEVKEKEVEEKPLRKRKPVEEEIVEEVVEEEVVVEEKPIRKAKPEPKEEPAKTEKTKCPHGYKWGSADEHKECGSCEAWDDCIDG